MLGQIARDLVLVVDEVPGPSGSADVRLRREMLGGKGANQAVGLAQLGMRPRWRAWSAQTRLASACWPRQCATAWTPPRSSAARAPVPRSSPTSSTPSGSGGTWKISPDQTLLTEDDVRACQPLFRAGRWVSVQLQQPAAAIGRPGGRPALTPQAIQDQLALLA